MLGSIDMCSIKYLGQEDAKGSSPAMHLVLTAEEVSLSIIGGGIRGGVPFHRLSHELAIVLPVAICSASLSMVFHVGHVSADGSFVEPN